VIAGERNKLAAVTLPADTTRDLSESDSNGNSTSVVSQDESLSDWNNQMELALIDGSLAQSASVSDDPTANSLHEGTRSIFKFYYYYLILHLAYLYVHLKTTGLSQITTANSGYWLSLVICLLLKSNLLVLLVLSLKENESTGQTSKSGELFLPLKKKRDKPAMALLLNFYCRKVLI
jgi:hypothetical protein